MSKNVLFEVVTRDIKMTEVSEENTKDRVNQR